jgi:hypothetical protein
MPRKSGGLTLRKNAGLIQNCAESRWGASLDHGNAQDWLLSKPYRISEYCPLQRTITPGAATISDRGGTHAELVCNRDAVEEGTRPGEEQLLGLETALTAFASSYSGSKPSRKRRKLSAKSRAKIAAAQRARWAKVRVKAKGRNTQTNDVGIVPSQDSCTDWASQGKTEELATLPLISLRQSYSGSSYGTTDTT